MAYTLTEVQQVLANLKATYLTLSQKTASELSMRDRRIAFADMEKVLGQIREFEERELLLSESANSQAPGVAYANFQRPS